jgi:transcriptional regulator with XRE-family HTH domain
MSTLTPAEHLQAALSGLRDDPKQAAAAAATELALQLVDGPADLAQLLRERREAAGLSQLRLASLAGLSVGTCKNLERGRTTASPDTLARLLGVSELGLVNPLSVAGQADDPGLQPNSYLTSRYDPARWANELRSLINGPGGTLEQSFLYLDNQSAADYLAVCEAYSSLRAGLFLQLQQLAQHAAPALKAPVHLVAIGSGDGRAEVCLAQSLAPLVRLQRVSLLDISNTLLSKAREHADAVLREHQAEVQAVHGSFHDLAHYTMLHAAAAPGQVRVFTLLGATMANLSDELRFFRTLRSLAQPGDLVVIDFQTVAAPADQPELVKANDPVLKNGGILPPPIAAWFAGPIKRHSERPITDLRFTSELAPGRVPGSYELEFVAMADASGFLRRYVVARSTRYDPEKLSQALRVVGWETLRSELYGNQSAAVMMFRAAG